MRGRAYRQYELPLFFIENISLSNIKPELANNALGSLTESPYGGSGTGLIDALWNGVSTWHQEVKTMTQQVNVPTFAEAWRAAMAASVEAHGPQVMVFGIRNDCGQ